MRVRNRLLVPISASLLLVLAQWLMLDHVHEHDELSSICAYCLSADNSAAIVTDAPIDAPVFAASAAQTLLLVTRPQEIRHSYASRAPPVISS